MGSVVRQWKEVRPPARLSATNSPLDTAVRPSGTDTVRS